MNVYELFRGALLGYLGILGVLGLVTLAWGMVRFGPSGEWLAAGWFAVAGAGTLLMAGLLIRYARRGADAIGEEP